MVRPMHEASNQRTSLKKETSANVNEEDRNYHSLPSKQEKSGDAMAPDATSEEVKKKEKDGIALCCAFCNAQHRSDQWSSKGMHKQLTGKRARELL